MNELYRDINIINGKGNLYNISEWDKIYSRSNENIDRLFSMLNLEDKDILTVLSSSDYLFSSLVSNIKSIDTFDINPLTLRYYYLRKWLLEKNYIDAKDIDYNLLREIVLNHFNDSSEYERETVKFWDYYFEKEIFYRLYSQSIFDNSGNPLSTIYDKKVLELNAILKDYNINFYNIDITKDYNLDKKYDVILLSNILDYCSKDKLEQAKHNLYNLLNENGEVIGVHMLKYEISLRNQRKVFSDMFTYEKLFFKPYINGNDVSIASGFTYYKYLKK